MRIAIRTWAGCVAAPLLTLVSSPAWCQAPPGLTPPVPVSPPPKTTAIFVEDVRFKLRPGKLEEMLAEALKNNPDVRVAESKLREAEAQLNRARMQVMQKAVTLRGALETEEGALKEAEAHFKATESKAKRCADLRKKGLVDDASLEEALASVEAAKQKLLAAKTRLAELENDVNFLQGKHRIGFTVLLQDAKGAPAAGPGVPYLLQNQFHAQVALELQRVIHAAPGSTADKIRKALDKAVRVDFNNKPLADILKDFQTAHGVNFVIASKKLSETNVTVKTEEMPLGAVLEMIEDMANVRFAVRDYGVLATSAEPLPIGAVPLYTFWKAAKVPTGGAARPTTEKDAKIELEFKP